MIHIGKDFDRGSFYQFPVPAKDGRRLPTNGEKLHIARLDHWMVLMHSDASHLDRPRDEYPDVHSWTG